MTSIKERLGSVSPRWLVRAYRRAAITREFARDCRDYARATLWRYGTGRPRDGQDDRECLESRLTLAYHGIEKGASFPNPKRPYGLSKIPEISELLNIADKRKVSTENAEFARSAVDALQHYNATGDISELVTPFSDWDRHAYDADAIDRFVGTRHSVRNYDLEARVSPELIRHIVAAAGTTPSVCNRRSYRAHYFDTPEQVAAILALQNGNRGFGHTVPGVFIVTVRRSSFVGAGERNQRWIDGGLFAMTLVWLCHARGLGTCFLNWSQTNSRTDQLRALADIPATEDVITYIAVGYPVDGHRVARSPLRSESDILVHHRRTPGQPA